MKRTYDWEGVEHYSPEWWQRYRQVHLDKLREYKRGYDSAMYKKHPLREKARRVRWQKANPEKVSAHGKVRRALQSGKLTKGPCGVCKNERVIAHHDDYTKPLDVLWLCEMHHKERHRMLNSKHEASAHQEAPRRHDNPQDGKDSRL